MSEMLTISHSIWHEGWKMWDFQEFALVLQAKSKSSFNFHGSVPLSLVA